MKKLKSLVLFGLLCLFVSSLVGCDRYDDKEYMNTSISYMLTLSPDLLKFVSPEVTYVDMEGNVHTVSGVQELDNLVITNSAATKHMDVWTIQTIKGTNYKCWTLNMSFINHPFFSYFGVKYKKQDIVEDTTGVVYDFHHSIFSTNILVTSIAKTKLKYDWLIFGLHPDTETHGTALIENHIAFTKNCYYKGGEVENYINDLIKTPDKIGFYISEDCKFTEKDDFPL